MKGDVKNKLHPGRQREIFSDIEPPPCGLRGALGPDPVGGRSIGFRAMANRRVSILSSEATSGNTFRCPAVWVVLATRVLSETRGLWLYGVIRGGLKWPKRLGASRWAEPSPLLETLPRTRTSERFTDPGGSRIFSDSVRLSQTMLGGLGF